MGTKKLSSFNHKKYTDEYVKSMVLQFLEFNGVDDISKKMVPTFLDLSLKNLELLCESEIEKQVGLALILGLCFNYENVIVTDFENFEKSIKSGISEIVKNSVIIIPNCWVSKKIRVDFLLMYKKKKSEKYHGLIIECDSFMYHSNQKQLTNEKERERKIQKLGYDILRFGGGEIYKNPTNVAYEIIQYMFN